MVHRIDIGLGPATTAERTHIVEHLVDQSWKQTRPLLVSAIQLFLSSRVSPTALLTFELALVSAVRELGRALLAATLNSLEPSDPTLLPRDLMYGGIGFHRRNAKTANRNLATCFGTITLYRRGYRSWDGVERSIFPTEMLLGICHSTTPALRDWIGRFMADAGASQDAVISWLKLKASLSVTMSVKRLRQVTEHLSDAMGELRQVHQVQRLLDLLEKAGNSRGSRKPVLSVGRDGITLRQYANSVFEVATAATISVYDRAGKRLGTVYLAWPPELGQATMDQMLTDILLELFEKWTGPLPRLA